MGLFNNLFKEENNKESTPKKNIQSSNTHQAVTENPYKDILDLSKPDDMLNLSKVDSTLENVRVAAGWDTGYDLDLCAYLLDKDGKTRDTVYYGDKTARGIHLDKDNLTGEGSGDDENIYTTLSMIYPRVSTIILAVVIYSPSIGEYFSRVKNAFVRLINEDNGYQVCRYNLSADGGKNTAVVAAKLYRNAQGEWIFQAIGDYSNDSIRSLERKLKKYL